VRCRLGLYIVALASLFAGVLSSSVRAQPPAVTPTRLKAAVVSKFPQFVEWPSVVFDGRTTLDVCVGAPDPFGADLPELLAGESLNGRSFVARLVEREADLAGCQLLYLSSRGGAGASPLLTAAASLPILTVGDDRRFLDYGGIVGLRIVDGRVRFDINATAAQRVGLRISSQLLHLALTVRGRVS
jgi:hypothetical protein